MTFAFRRWIVLYPTNVLLVAVVSSGIYIVTDGIVSPRVKDASSMMFHVLVFINVCYMLLVFAVLIGTAISLVRRKWHSATSYFLATCVAYVSLFGAAALKGDRFAFANWSHREVADIYNQRRSELYAFTSRGTHLVALEEQCHPPRWCECWILWDPARASGAEKEIGGWHRPTASIFPPDSGHFAIVTVRQLDADAYSVLSCGVDWTSFKPV